MCRPSAATFTQFSQLALAATNFQLPFAGASVTGQRMLQQIEPDL
jgi:hypothetical protein